MSSSAESLSAGGPAAPARPASRTGPNRRRYGVDRLARRFVTASGTLIIAAILAILFVIASVALPLLRPARAAADGELALPAGTRPLALRVDEYREEAFVANAAGVLMAPLEGGVPSPATLPSLGTATVTGAVVGDGGLLALGLSDGRILPVQTSVGVTYAEGKRSLAPAVAEQPPIVVDEAGAPVGPFGLVVTPDGPVAAAVVGGRRVVVVAVAEKTSLVGESHREEERRSFDLPVDGEATAVVVDGRGQDVVVGTSTGRLLRIDRHDPSDPRVAEALDAAEDGAAVTALVFLNGDRTLVVGDARGRVSSWQVIQDEGGARRLTLIHRFRPHAAAVTSVSPSRRDKGFVTGDEKGGVLVHYGTTGRTLLDLPAGKAAVRSVAFAPKADGIAAVDAAGTLRQWRLDNPHPEVTWNSLFGKVWYEGYAQPEHVWQSTGGTDDFEAKFSLTPLVYGTLKGTFYALIVAIPLALMGALYTSQFLHPDLKSFLKPTVEIMAALPSVVLGFIAGLWLAPMLERVAPGVLLMPIVIPLLTFLTVAGWTAMPVALRRRFPHGTELLLLVPVVVLAGALAIWLGQVLEAGAMAGDYRTWLLSALGLTYDQRNSLVVGLAMGFAVIPIIFTVAEDSLASVPQGLTAGSLALGATRWQTALRVVLPTASPGIFSAIMIGFGRAVGETMIVLMATGNTPVMEASMFNGFRALSANIAVELPEAPEGGTLFRVLFLAALLLFSMTFVVNTLAEVVRLRLRRKYRTFE